MSVSCGLILSQDLGYGQGARMILASGFIAKDIKGEALG
jgi:hypothetical protein